MLGDVILGAVELVVGRAIDAFGSSEDESDGSPTDESSDCAVE